MADVETGIRKPRVDQDRNEIDDDLLARISYLYYVQEFTQGDIANQLGLSRFKVLRLLKEARKRGIVRIEVASPIGECMELEDQLRQMGLTDAVVAPVVDDAPVEAAAEAIGIAAGKFMRDSISHGTSVGIAWGRTVAEVVKAMREFGARPDVSLTVVQLMGGIGELDYTISSSKLGSDLAAIYGGQCHFLHAPAIVESADLCRQLREEPSIRQTMELARAVDIALVGVGRVDEESGLVQGHVLSPRDVALVAGEGAVGSICACFFDENGRECVQPLGDRIVGISLDDLKRIPTRVLVAGGEAKEKAILAAIRGGLGTVLITDKITARHLVEYAST